MAIRWNGLEVELNASFGVFLYGEGIRLAALQYQQRQLPGLPQVPHNHPP